MALEIFAIANVCVYEGVVLMTIALFSGSQRR